MLHLINSYDSQNKVSKEDESHWNKKVLTCIQLRYTSVCASAQSDQVTCISPAEPFDTVSPKVHCKKLWQSQTKF